MKYYVLFSWHFLKIFIHIRFRIVDELFPCNTAVIIVIFSKTGIVLFHTQRKL